MVRPACGFGVSDCVSVLVCLWLWLRLCGCVCVVVVFVVFVAVCLWLCCDRVFVVVWLWLCACDCVFVVRLWLCVCGCATAHCDLVLGVEVRGGAPSSSATAGTIKGRCGSCMDGANATFLAASLPSPITADVTLGVDAILVDGLQ